MKKSLWQRLCSLLLCCVLLLSCTATAGAADSSDSSDIKVGDKITLGRYDGKAISWVCILIDDNGPLFLSENALCKKEYDAAGTDSYYHSDGWGRIRRERGSNCWSDSNIRQWLNASGTVEYTHCPPSYAEEDGFLTGFSDREKACIKTVTQKTNLNEWDAAHREGYLDGGQYESADKTTISGLKNVIGTDYWYQNVTDQVFLLDEQQIYQGYNNLPDVISAMRYLTRISNNAGASYECLRMVAGNGEKLDTSGAYTPENIRPAIYIDTANYSDLSARYIKDYEKSSDKYNFINTYHVLDDGTVNISGAADSISIDYYKNMFGPLFGSILFYAQEKGNPHGVCYGMTASTSLFLQNKELIKKFNYRTEMGQTEIDNIHGVFAPFDTYFENTSYSIEDLVKQLHVSQHIPWLYIQLDSNVDNIEGLYNAVKNSVNNDGIPVRINIYKGTYKSPKSSHSILAVGYDETKDNYIIKIDDPNSLLIDNLVIKKDFSGWEYGKYNSDIGGITFDIPNNTSAIVSMIISNMIDSTIKTGELVTSSVLNATMIKGDSIKSASVKLYELFSSNDENISDSSEDESKLYWSENGVDSITLSSEKKDDVTVASYSSSITVACEPNTDITYTVSESDFNSVKYESDADKEQKIVFTTTKDDDIIELVISGDAIGGKINAAETDTGVTVTGLKNVTVTLNKNGDELNKKESDEITATCEITYDKNGQNDILQLTNVLPCKHICHSENRFAKFIWRVIVFICKIFGIDKTCKCGVKHF